MRLLLFLLAALAPAADLDCRLSYTCPVIQIAGEREARLSNGAIPPLRGFASPSLRQDPVYPRLWLAYAQPHIRPAPGARDPFDASPASSVRLAVSDDRGRIFRTLGDLWPAEPGRAPNGEEGLFSYESPSLLPVTDGRRTVWYGARLQTFLPHNAGFQRRIPESFRIVISRAEGPQNLARTPVQRLGARSDWEVDVNLTRLPGSFDARSCDAFADPALAHDGAELYLALTCLVIRGNSLNLDRTRILVFATKADRDPRYWDWRFAGNLASRDEARALNADRLSRLSFARHRDGHLLALLSPEQVDSSRNELAPRECLVLEAAFNNGRLELARTPSGALNLLARVSASLDHPPAIDACAYDPASQTGLILGKRTRPANRGQAHRPPESVFTLHSTGLHP